MISNCNMVSDSKALGLLDGKVLYCQDTATYDSNRCWINFIVRSQKRFFNQTANHS